MLRRDWRFRGLQTNRQTPAADETRKFVPTLIALPLPLG